MVLCFLEGVASKVGFTGNFSIMCKYPLGFYPENKQKAFRIPHQGQHLGQDLFCGKRVSLLDGFVPPVLNRWCQRLLFPAAAILLLLPEWGCWRCRRLEKVLEKAKGKEKG